MAQKKLPPNIPRKPRLICENGHFATSDDELICQKCHSEFMIHPSCGLSKEAMLEFEVDFGLRDCPNAHFHDPKLPGCPRCLSPPLSLQTATPPTVTEPPPLKLVPIEDPISEEEAALIESGGFKIWMSEEELGIAKAKTFSGYDARGEPIAGPSRLARNAAPSGYGRWIWYPKDGGPIIKEERVLNPSGHSSPPGDPPTSSPPKPVRSRRPPMHNMREMAAAATATAPPARPLPEPHRNYLIHDPVPNHGHGYPNGYLGPRIFQPPPMRLPIPRFHRGTVRPPAPPGDWNWAFHNMNWNRLQNQIPRGRGHGRGRGRGIGGGRGNVENPPENPDDAPEPPR